MLLDYSSLLAAIGFSGAGLVLALLGSWFSARSDGFLLTWSIGAALIVAHAFAYRIYVARADALVGSIAFGLFIAGVATIYCAGRQFRLRRVRPVPTIGFGLTAVLAVVLPMSLGLSGLAFILENLAAAAFLLATAWEYWLARREARIPLLALSTLYATVAASFALCALVLIGDGELVLAGAPSNWAEELNLVVSLAGFVGIGAVSLALNHWRAAGLHQHDALTDALTGLLNRRALFDAFGTRPVPKGTALVLFDLDHFKTINDEHGHATGDEVLTRFAAVLAAGARRADRAARIGGEEFVLVLPATPQDGAVRVADRIRAQFAELAIVTESGIIQATVSAGIAFANEDRQSLDALLGIADKALYAAKREGRNRIALPGLRLAS
jgi:diguanylate cyclase (GGDEF)-like protein